MQQMLETEQKSITVRGASPVTNGKPAPIRWTVDEYYQMGDVGLLDGKRVQLVRGEIIEMAPMGSPHSTAVRLVTAALTRIFNEDYLIDSQLPVRLSRTDEPEPDVAVIRGTIRDYSDAHPRAAVLVVEVADTSLRLDRGRKGRMYAEFGIEDYWIVNLRDRCVEVYRRPVEDSDQGWIYSELRTLTESDTVSPLAAPDASISIHDLVP